MSYRNLPELLHVQAERFGHRPAVRYRRYGLWHDMGYDDYLADAVACASALVEAGIRPGDRVGLLAENRLEWLLADMGLMAAGAVNVPPHAPLTAPQVQFQLADSGARWLFVSTRTQLEKMLPVLPELRDIMGVVVFDRDRVAVETAAVQILTMSAVQVRIFTWDGFLQRGRRLLTGHFFELQRRLSALRSHDLATIMYTSGTTGNPKGVMLTHGNLLSNAESVLRSQPADPEDVQFCWLPFSHIYARTMDHYRTLAAGIPLALAESADTVIRDVGEIQPTHMNSVPRLYEKVLAAVAPSSPTPLPQGERGETIGSPLPSGGEGLGVRGQALQSAHPSPPTPLPQGERRETIGSPLPSGGEGLGVRGQALQSAHPSPPTPLPQGERRETSRGEGDWKRKLHDIFGKRLKSLCSGGAPLPLAIAQAYHDAGLLLLQGYGLTESSPVISFNRTTRYKLDTVGPALEGVEIKIAPDGEVLSRGPHIMKGYWKNPEATAEAIQDGWLHTGDLGSIDADGFLKITGRKKDIMVMSSGKKVVPAQIEGLLLADPCIDQVVVYGEGKNFLTALIVPHWENVRKELEAHGRPSVGLNDPTVYALLDKRVAAALGDVSSWETVKKFVILPQPFSVAAEELTVSLKLRRNVILTKYREQLDALYRE